MDCKKDINKAKCNCTFACSRKGMCCDCLAYHRNKGELPGCYFPDDYEKNGDRSIQSFIRLVEERGVWL